MDGSSVECECESVSSSSYSTSYSTTDTSYDSCCSSSSDSGLPPGNKRQEMDEVTSHVDKRKCNKAVGDDDDDEEIEEDDNEEEEEKFEDIPKNYDPRRKGNANNAAGSSLSTAVAENPYIFDDEDFYRVLLNDLIDKKISGTDTLQDSESIIKVTAKSGNSNNKLNRNIDTRASKGRKLNYSIQQPLANYEAPTGTGYRWSDEQIDEFFAGLLGRKINFNEDEEGEEERGEEEEEELNAIKDDDIQIFG